MKAGYPRRPRKEERNQAMLKDYEGGMLLREIAEKYGLSESRTGAVVRNQYRWNKEAQNGG